jgi:citrate:succinate antiporter/L-tartrate/succinate antiporter
MLRFQKTAASPGCRARERRRPGGNEGARVKITWKTIAPLAIWLAIYLVPVPAGLNPDQWHYFAIFGAVIAV